MKLNTLALGFTILISLPLCAMEGQQTSDKAVSMKEFSTKLDNLIAVAIAEKITSGVFAIRLYKLFVANEFLIEKNLRDFFTVCVHTMQKLKEPNFERLLNNFVSRVERFINIETAIPAEEKNDFLKNFDAEFQFLQ